MSRRQPILTVGGLMALEAAESVFVGGGAVTAAETILAAAILSFDGVAAAKADFLLSARFRRRVRKVLRRYQGDVERVKKDAAALADYIAESLKGPRVEVPDARPDGGGKVPLGWGLLAAYLATFGGRRDDLLRMPVRDAYLTLTYSNILSGRLKLIGEGRGKLIEAVRAQRAAKQAAAEEAGMKVG